MSFYQMITEVKAEEEKVIEQAYSSIEKKYHSFIKMLEKNQKVSSKELELSDELKKMGVFLYRGGTYLKTYKPYVLVDGRVQMAVDEAIEKGAEIEIGPPNFEEIRDELICTVKVKTPRGTAFGTAKVGVGGGGVDSTNPYENAQTSAVGRALAFLGYGLIGTGIASAEEVEQATHEREKISEVKQKNSTSNYYTLMGSRIQEKNGKKLCVIAVQQGNKSFPVVVSPEIDFQALNLKKGQPIELTLQQQGDTLIATEIKEIKRPEHKAVV